MNQFDVAEGRRKRYEIYMAEYTDYINRFFPTDADFGMVNTLHRI